MLLNTLKMKVILGFCLVMLMIGGCRSESLDRLTITSAQAQQLYSLGGVEAMGNSKGTTTLVVISSYECHYCRDDFPVIQKFVAQHPNIKLIYKSYLAFGLDTQVEAQYAALAAAKQHQFAAMNAALFKTDRALNHVTIMAIARALKLDMPRFVSDKNSQAVKDQVMENTILMDQLAIQGIPTVIMAPSAVIHDSSLPQYIQVGFISADVLEEMYRAVV